MVLTVPRVRMESAVYSFVGLRSSGFSIMSKGGGGGGGGAEREVVDLLA